MRKLLTIFALLLVATSVHAAITYIGTSSAYQSSSSITVALPSGSNGDLILCTASTRNASLTIPQPSAATYTELIPGSTYTFHKVWARIATGTDTFTLAALPGYTQAWCSRFRGTSSNLAAIIDTSITKRFTQVSAIRLGALTPSANNEMLWYSARLQGPGTTSPSVATPTSFTEVMDSYYTASDEIMSSGYWIQTTATTSAQQDLAVTPAATAATSNTSILLALVPAAGGGSPTISSVNIINSFVDGMTGIVIAGTNFGSSTGTVNLLDGATTCPQTVTGWGPTSITFTAAIGSCRYGASTINVIVSGGGSFVNQSVTVQASASKCYFNLGTLLQPFAVDINGAPNRFGDATSDIANNSQLEFSNMTFSGASSCANITVNSDGSYKVPADLQTLDWRWNIGAGWNTTGTSLTGQGKVHLVSSAGFRSVLTAGNCGNVSPNPGVPPRTPATKTICVSGCDYPNTTVGIAACMAVLSNGQSCEMRDQVGGIQETWTQPIVIASVNGVEGSVKTLRVQDGDSIIVSGATSATTPLLSINSSSHVNVQGNSSGNAGLYIGDPSVWAYSCAQDPSSPTFTPPFNCYPNGMNTDIASSSDIGLMNLTLGGAFSNVASRVEKTSSYVYMEADVVSLQGSNDNLAATNPVPEGLLFEQDSAHFIAEDTHWTYSGLGGLKVTGSFNVLRRDLIDNSWYILTGSSQYKGNETLQIVANDCSDAHFGCAPYGPVLVDNSEFRGSGLTPANSPSNAAVELKGIGVIFRGNFVYGNDRTYLLALCGTVDVTTTAYREGEQQIYNNTLFGGANLFMGWGSAYPGGINSAICQEVVIADNLFQGNQPGQTSLYAFTANLGSVPLGGYANAWKGANIFSNVFGTDPSNPSLNMQVSLTGTGAGIVALNNSTQWPTNFHNNSSLNMVWANGSNQPGLSRPGLILGTSNTTGVGDSAAITTTTNAGTSVTSVTLADPKAFKDTWGFTGHSWGGWKTESGDCIAVGPTTSSLNYQAVVTQITAINYSTGVATVTPAVTFQTGSPVWKAIDDPDGTCGPVYRNHGAAQ